MKKSKIILMLSLLVGTYQLTAQTITVGGSPLNLPCNGGTVNLTALGNSSLPVFGDNFNTGSVSPGWVASPAAQFNNPCGASMDGTTYLWMGPGTSAPRTMTTAEVDVSCGGQVCFNFKFTCESCGDNSPCEGADLYNEGVSLQWSIDGITWTDMAYFAPNGNLLTAYPGAVTTPVASGATAFTTWQNYCFNIPAAAFSNNTQFRTYQWGSSGSTFDHWGIDNFYVYATPCVPFYYDWAHIPGAPNPQNTTVNVTSTTTFTCCYTNGTLSACQSVTVNVATLPPATVTVTSNVSCTGTLGTATINNPGGNGPYQIVITGPVNNNYTEGNGPPDDLDLTNLPAGTYNFTTTSNAGCTNTGSFTILPATNCLTVTATSTPVLCFGQTTGTATANPSNGVPGYTYIWYTAGMVPIPGQTAQTANNLAAGNYFVKVTDNTGFSVTVPVTVTGPAAALSATATPTQPLCFGNCNGSITVNPPTGGTPAYQYSLNGGAFGSTSTFSSLCAGTYNIVVRDQNNCTFPISVPLNQPTDLTLTQTAIAPATCGQNNGSVTLTAGGGTPTYTYALTGPMTPPTNSSGIFSSLQPGSYTATVTDFKGCTETLPVTIVAAPGPVASIALQTNVACAGALTGSVIIGATGGTPTLQYKLEYAPFNVFQTSNTFNGVVAGTHTATVQDANGCQGTVVFTITQPTPLSFTTALQHVSCNGVCDGQITVTASNATPPYQYSVDGGPYQVSNVLTGLCAGLHNVVVKDNNGCLANSNVTITQPPVFSCTYAHTDPECYQTPTGSITFTPAGGTAPYEFSIDGGTSFSTTNPALNLMAGVYDVIAKDDHDCEVTSTITLIDPPPFDFLFIANNPSNCGAQDGSFEIIATSGLAPYNYSIDGTDGPFQFENGYFDSLFAGLYNLVVIDANGCIDSVYSALSDNVMTPILDLVVDATCYGGNEGIGAVSQANGSFPFTYTLTPGAVVNTTGFFTDLTAGTYYVEIEDNGLCIAFQEFTVNQPDTITMTLTPVHVTCNNGSNGQITVSAPAGGHGVPYQYSLDNITYQASPTFTGLTAGTYIVYTRDGFGCVGAEEIELEEPNPFNVVVSTVDLECYNDGNGFAQVFASGSNPGTYTFTVLGEGTNTTGIFPSLDSNTYSLTVMDVLGCPYNTTFNISQPPPLLASYVVNDALCNGDCDGSVVVTATGGTPIYLYSHDGGVTLQPGSTLANLCAGNHNIFVKDDNNCSVTAVQVVNEPTLITMAFVINPATCGLNNGDLTINATDGTPGYDYSADNGITFQPLNVFTNLAPGNHFIVVEDNNGCQISGTAVVGNDALPVINNIVAVDPLCNGDNTGSITIAASGGVGTIQYSINGGTSYQASNVFNNLPAGIYPVQIEDGNGCIATTTITLTNPAVLTFNAVVTDLLCNGDLTGEIAIAGNGGTGLYLYSIDNGANFQGGGNFTGVAAGNYDVVVEDENGCQATGIQTVNEPATLIFNSFAIQNPSCFGICDGEVSIAMSGGTAPYTYIWMGGIGASTTLADSLCDGSYSVLVMDDNGCQVDSLSFVLTQPAPVPLTGVTPTDVLCYGGNTGTITVNAPTAVQYSLDGGPYQVSNVFGGLTAGIYDVVAQAADGCESGVTVEVLQPDSVYAIAPSNWFGCFNADVIVQAFINGGIQPYTYQWTNNIDATVMTTDTFTYTIVLPAPGIDFTLVVTDNNGCPSAPVTYNVSSTPPLATVAGNDTTICLDGTATLYANTTGGALIDFGPYLGYSYDWNTGVVGDTLQSVTVSPTTQTMYTVTVTDLCGQVVQDSMMVSLYVDPIPTVVGGGNGCLPELMTFDNPDYLNGTCLWNFGDGTTSTDCGTTSHLYTQTGCFDVTLTLTSSDGCPESMTYNDLVCISPLPEPGFYWSPHSPSVLHPTVTIIDYAENTESYLYNFGGMGTSTEPAPTFTFPETQEEVSYEVCQYVTSPDGCMDTLCQMILVHEEIIFYVPNVFTPDGDPNNQTFKPVITSGIDMYNYHLTIFNRWGEVLFESFNYDFGWDGTYGDEGLVADGVYIWQIEFGEKLTDKRQTHRGHVTVLK